MSSLRLKLRFIAIAILIQPLLVPAQQPIDPIDFRPFSDGEHWIVKEPLIYRIGDSQDSVTVPVGFVTDMASIPAALRSIIQQNGPYLLPAVVHDYLYWKQDCTRDQADSIFRLAMIENDVDAGDRRAIFLAVRAAGRYAWNDNTAARTNGLIRIIPRDYLRIPANTSWSEYRQRLEDEELPNAPHEPVSQEFCERGSMSIDDALGPP